MKMKISFLLLMPFLSVLAYGFDEKRCFDDNVRLKIDYGNVFAPSTTTSQATSSWGGCSLVGRREQRQEYIVMNLENIKKDSARGSGEFLATLGGMYGCPVEESEIFNQILKQNHSHIFETSSATGFIVVRLENLIKETKTINHCHL